MSKIDELIKYVQSKGRVCPVPNFWNELWQMLPDRKQKASGGWEPSLPLILAAWWDTTDAEKRERLIYHINYAAKKGIIEKIDKYLRSLKEEDWLHEGEISNKNLGI